MLRKIIEDEINYEKALLADLETKISENINTILTFSCGSFHYRDPKSKKYKYLKKSDGTLLWNITANRYRIEKAKILKANIHILRSVLSKLSDYDDTAVICNMPKAYCEAISYLRENAPLENVIQSENPKYRDGLIITASDGLKLRTKGELNLYETLKSYGLNVRYEKRLTLIEKTLLQNGKIEIKEVEVYPDFTIIFPDGFKIYWELNGLYDNPKYRRTQFDKINLYYDNDIYMPKNLIITMESENKPLDLITIRRIIEAQILPLMEK